MTKNQISCRQQCSRPKMIICNYWYTYLHIGTVVIGLNFVMQWFWEIWFNILFCSDEYLYVDHRFKKQKMYHSGNDFALPCEQIQNHIALTSVYVYRSKLEPDKLVKQIRANKQTASADSTSLPSPQDSPSSGTCVL